MRNLIFTSNKNSGEHFSIKYNNKINWENICNHKIKMLGLMGHQL